MKVGDKVRVIDDQCGYSLQIGEKDLNGYEGVITWLSEPFQWSEQKLFGVDVKLNVDGVVYEKVNFDSDELEVIE